MNAINCQQSLTLMTKPEPAEPEISQDNNWQDDPAIIIHHQPRTKVYLNVKDQLVIRQERDWCEEDDPFVYISREHLPTLIRELQSYLP